MAACPTARTALRTKSTSTSDAYLDISTESCPLYRSLHLFHVLPSWLYRRMEKNVLSQFAQKGIDILLTREPHHDVQLFHLDIRRVVVFAEKDAHLVGQDIRPFLE